MLNPSQSSTIIDKLSSQAFLRMDASKAQFMAEFVPKLEREGNKNGPIRDAELLCEVIQHHFLLTARECMRVCGSAHEFEIQMRGDIPRFVHFSIAEYPWIAEGMRQELDAAFGFYFNGVNPWTRVSDEDRKSVWHVGAITGEALAHLALKLRAEALQMAVENTYPQAPPSAGNVSAGSDIGREQQPKRAKPTFPNRAMWLKTRLQERAWSKHDLALHGGPDHKTTQKIIDGIGVREEVLQKVAQALSTRKGNVDLLDIPSD